jgi:hypothetical protein
MGRLLGSVKKREKADGEDREEETQGEGDATSKGEADTQQARWQRAPQDGSRAPGPSQDGGAAQGGLTKARPPEDISVRPDRGPAIRPKTFSQGSLLRLATGVGAVNPRARRSYLSNFRRKRARIFVNGYLR